jgi:hypothetical protein
VEWSFLNMDENPDALLAPNGGAREMLRWAKTNPGEFFRTFVVKLLPVERKNAEPLPPESQEDGLAREFMDALERKPANSTCASPSGQRVAGGPPPPAVAPASEAADCTGTSAPEPALPQYPEVAIAPLCAFCRQHGAQRDCGVCYEIERNADLAAGRKPRLPFPRLGA